MRLPYKQKYRIRIWTKFLFPPKYPKIYVTIDIHGTILKPTFSTDLSTRFYPFSSRFI